MPITPPVVPGLLDLYDDLVTGSEDLVGAAASLAPAAAREVLCSIGGLASLGAGPFGSLQSPGTGNRTLSDAAGILQAACPVPPPAPEPPAPPFEGGQCAGVQYRVFGEGGGTFQGQPQTRTSTTPDAQVTGPITGVREGVSPVSGLATWFIQHQGGESESGVTTPAGFWTERTWKILSVERVDGLPDDCGDPTDPDGPPPRPPIVQPPSSPPIPRVDPDGDPLPPVIIIPRVGPIIVGPDGGLQIPVVINLDIDGGDTNVSIPVNVSLPDFNPTFNFGGGGGSPTGDPGDQEPGPPQGVCCEPPPPLIRPAAEEDPDQPPEEDTEPDRRIAGVVVTSFLGGGESSATTLFNPVPEIRVPRIATVQFQLKAGESEFFSAPVQVKNLKEYVPAPPDVTVLRAFCGWESGWDGSLEYILVPVNPRA